MVNLNKNMYARHKNIHTVVRQRLIEEGRYDDYKALVANLKAAGLPESGEMAAWKVAAFPFAPISGGPGELKADPMYAAIAADWANGKYDDVPKRGFVKFPSGMTNFEKLDGEPAPELKQAVERIKKAPKDYADKWEDLALKVKGRTASPQEIVEWVVANEPFSIENIDPESVPSTTAITLLKYAKASVPNLGDVLKTIWVKLMPDRRTVEYENRFRDTGQDLTLLEEFEASLRAEEAA